MHKLNNTNFWISYPLIKVIDNNSGYHKTWFSTHTLTGRVPTLQNTYYIFNDMDLDNIYF